METKLPEDLRTESSSTKAIYYYLWVRNMLKGTPCSVRDIVDELGISDATVRLALEVISAKDGLVSKEIHRDESGAPFYYKLEVGNR